MVVLTRRWSRMLLARSLFCPTNEPSEDASVSCPWLFKIEKYFQGYDQLDKQAHLGGSLSGVTQIMRILISVNAVEERKLSKNSRGRKTNLRDRSFMPSDILASCLPDRGAGLA